MIAQAKNAQSAQFPLSVPIDGAINEKSLSLAVPGVYLIHFSKPIGNRANRRATAQHYIGSAFNIRARIRQHRQSKAAALITWANKHGIAWQWCVFGIHQASQ